LEFSNFLSCGNEVGLPLCDRSKLLLIVAANEVPSFEVLGTSGRACHFTVPEWGVKGWLGFVNHTDTRTLQAYLGHRNIQHTVRDTELSPTRFKNLWRDWRRLPDLCQESRADKAHPMVWRIHRIAFVQSLLDDLGPAAPKPAQR
jgi:hypothetical protein